MWLGHSRPSQFSPDVKAHMILGLNFRLYTTPVNPHSVPFTGNEDGCMTCARPIRLSLGNTKLELSETRWEQ